MKKIFSFLFVVLFSVSLWADDNTYYYKGEGNGSGWTKTAMSVSSTDGFYEYYRVTSNFNHQFLIGTAENDNAYNKNYVSAGFNSTNVSEIGNYGETNCYCWLESDHYILVYKPNTTVNSSNDPKICAATYLPDNRTISVYFVNSNNWEGTIKAYGWYYQNSTNGSANSSFPGVAMNNTGKTYNGHAIWSYEFPQSYEKAIFTNKTSSEDTEHSQTGDLELGRDNDGKMYIPGTGWRAYSYDGTLTLVPGAGGKVSFDGDTWSDAETTQSYTLATTQNIYAQANTGYTFAGWTKTAGSGTLDTEVTPQTYSVVLSSQDRVEAAFSEIKSNLTVTKTCTSAAESTCGSYATPTPSVNKIGVTTTATISATAAPAGYKLTWTLTNCELAAGALNSAEITVRSMGNDDDASAVVNYDEDLSSRWSIRGGAQFGESWGHDNLMLKKSGESTTAIAYYTVNITETNQDGSNSAFQFKIYDLETGGDAAYYGLTADGDSYWVIRANDDKEARDLKTTGKNIELRADVTGEYVIKVDYQTFQPTITITFPAKTPPTAIDNTEVSEKAVKRIENGQLVIIKNGVKYNALGAEVK